MVIQPVARVDTPGSICQISPNLAPPPLKLGRQIFFSIVRTDVPYDAVKFGDDPVIAGFRGNSQTRCPKVPQTFDPNFSETPCEHENFFPEYERAWLRDSMSENRRKFCLPKRRIQAKTAGRKWGLTHKLEGNSRK